MKKLAAPKRGLVRVNVKLAARADQTPPFKTLSALRGVLNVIQTFPNEADQELTNLYLLEVDQSQIKSALRELRTMPGVEYAEEAAPRQLIRGAAYDNA